MAAIPENRTPCYIGTFNYHCPKDLETIQQIRKSTPKGRYIKLQGRIGKNRSDEVIEKYRRKSANWRAAYCVELKDSAYVDAYMYTR